ncbi:MAG: HD-GYP domain-containing protein [Solidesulfovibrio magneticus str. Maddingley MBC34]|uniref:HD-GYP domain-containing protein n=1 Tax=Solidesulfovibrio magneticus str. Maddingley MBC34 TaxID=1206767 RepID=K6FPR4_9BACT|nr:MAG: HD-GYP domain-containing protein [Solidesulfovibrio magneticus str. Maddingley MBC34]
MSFDAYQTENSVIARGEAVLKDPASADIASEYESLLSSYRKLLKITDRLVRMSDRFEERLKVANITIQKQQLELEKANAQLAEYANHLEDKVKERTKELVAAQAKLERLVRLGIALSMERRHARFMEMIVDGQRELANADGGILFSRGEDGNLACEILRFDSLALRQGGLSGQSAPAMLVAVRDAAGRPCYHNPIAHALLTERTINIPDIYSSTDFDFSDLFTFDQRHAYRTQSFLAVPLKPRQGEVMGVLVLLNAHAGDDGRVDAFSEEAQRFIEVLASQAAVAQDNQNLLDTQAKLLDAIIKVIAGAIDTKSPYTGGHCARVPVIGAMLAKSACECRDGTFADFDLNESEWHEFHLACWLHDCGKVTTPEHIVDKATKLETVYNRIHEIRMRFEVLLRDAKIECLEAMRDKSQDANAKEVFDQKVQALCDDFSFVAACNVGGEFMSNDKIERLQNIAQRKWLRHFDDRIGLSQAELQRCPPTQDTVLPVVEHLLADKAEHLFMRPKNVGLLFDPTNHGISMDIPKHLYNIGELYNLKIPRGTLTREEYFKIKEHTIYTMIMLQQLPFPKELGRVAQIAAAHHETVAGTGYPRGLDVKDLPVQSRILAISDIFEALTASDRPYKKAKTLNEAIKIMSVMRNEQHIDADLFDLFLTTGVYKCFAEKYLRPEQIDAVNIELYLSRSIA